jgi:aminotransferase
MFGDDSTDYIRISYLQPLPMIQEAMRRITAFAQSVRVAA